MKLVQLFITEEIGCIFHDGLNIILGVNHGQARDVEGDFKDIGGADSEEQSVDDSDAVNHDETEKAPEAVEDNLAEEASENVSDTNGVGKTMLVSVMKYILGGDTETALASTYFTNGKYWGMLEISNGSERAIVARPLWRPLGDNLYLVFNGSLSECRDHLTKAQIKLEEVTSPQELADQLDRVKSPIMHMSKKEFQRHIAKLENIDYSTSNITLSALLDFMVRDEKVGFGDPIARIRRAQWLQYRSAQYLFGLPASTEETCSKLQERIAELRVNLKAMRERLDAQDITSDDKIENLKLHATAKLKKIRVDIEEVKGAPSLEQARLDYQKTRIQFGSVTSDLNKKEHYLRGYTKNREDLRTKSKAMTELLKVSEFYDDLIQFFPEQLEKNIAEFQAFFDDLSSDRERYYADLITEIRADIKFLKAEKSRLEPLLASLAKQFKSTSLLRDISTLAATEERAQNEIKALDECRKILLECEAQEEKVADLETLRRDSLTEGKKQEKMFKERRKGLITLFHELVSEIYGADDGELAFEYNSTGTSSTAGRTEITCRIPSQRSHGRTYARINIFDFVWFLGEKGEDDFKPGFLIHDGSYSKISPEVKPKMLKAICSRMKNQQYFITINEGELDIPADWKKSVCCRLDGSQVKGKFFEEQFD